MNDEFEIAPLAKILEIGSKADFNKVTSNCSYFMLFKNTPLPKVHNSFISQIRENHNIKEKIGEVLYTINFTFPVITQSIADLARDINRMSENNQIYSSVFIFYSFFGWFINYTKTGRVYPADVVFSALLKIHVNTNFENLAKSCFYFGYKTLTESKNSPLFDKYLSTAREYFLGDFVKQTEKSDVNDRSKSKSEESSEKINKQTIPSLTNISNSNIFSSESDHILQKLPKNSANLFVFVLNHFMSENQEFTEELKNVFRLINDTIEERPELFIDEIIDFIVNFIHPFLLQNETTVLECFSNLIKISKKDYSDLLITYFNETVIKEFYKKAEEDNFIEETQNIEQNITVLRNDIEIIQDFQIPAIKTFPNGFQKAQPIDIKADLEDSIYTRYKFFIEALIEGNEIHLNKLVEALITEITNLEDGSHKETETNTETEVNAETETSTETENNTETSTENTETKETKKETYKSSINKVLVISGFGLYLASFLLDQNGNRSGEIHTISMSILHKLAEVKSLFDPKFTIFSYITKGMSAIRNKFLELMCSRSSMLHNFLNSYQIYPVLFTEIIYRLTELRIKIPHVFLEELMNYFRYMDISGIESESVELVRSALLNYIEQIYYNDLFDSNTVQISYFLCLMEESLTDEIVKILTTYFHNIEKVVDSKSFCLFLKYLQINSTNPSEQLLVILSHFIDMLILIFEEKPKFITDFTNTFNQILELIIKIKFTKEFLFKILSLFIIISPEYEINLKGSIYLKNLIIDAYDNLTLIKRDENLYKHLKNVISYDNKKINNGFMIEVVYVLFKDEKFEDFWNFLMKIFSEAENNRVILIRNSRKCNIAGFDSFLIKQITEIKAQTFSEENEMLIKKLLLLFEKIEIYSSSPSVVLSFISLLKTNENKTLSRYMPFFMNTLYKLVDYEYWRKTKHMKLHMKEEFEGNFKVSNSFSICFWINGISFESDNEQRLNIFSAKSQDTNDSICIYISGNSVKIEINSFKHSKNIKDDEWTFVTVSFTEKSINIFFNLAPVATSEPLNLSHEISFHGRIGDSLTFSDTACIELGFFGVLQYQTLDDLKCLYHGGVCSRPINPIFAYSRKRSHSNLPSLSNSHVDDLLDLKERRSSLITAEKPLKISTPERRSSVSKRERRLSNTNPENEFYNFVFCLVNLWRCDLLIPLFGMFDTKFEDTNQLYSELPFITVDIITKCLTFNTKLQKSFLETNKLPIISYLLMNTNSRFINVDLYHKFDKMYLCVTDEKLHAQLFHLILTNFDLIMKSSSKDHFTILEKWLSDVALMPKFIKLRPFSVLMTMMNIYYDFSNKTESEILDIFAKRDILHSLLLFAADQSFAINDYYEIVDQCVKAETIEQSEDMLLLLKLLVLHSPSNFKKIGITIQDIFRLHKLLRKNNEKLASNLIVTVTVFYQQNILDKELSLIHFGVFIMEMTSIQLSDHFYKNLLPFSTQTPELYLMCCWYISTHASNNSELQEIFTNSLSAFFALPKNTLSNPLYLFWSIAFINCCSSTLHEHALFTFITDILADEWYLLIPAILAFSKTPDSTVMDLLNLVYTNKKYHDQEHFVKLAIMFIFMRPKKASLFEKLFHGSLFDELSNSSQDKQQNNSNSTNQNDNFKNNTLNKNNQQKEEVLVSYGLRFDDDMNWLDYEFAKLIYSLGESYNFSSLPLILRFISHINKEFSEQQTKRIDFTKLECDEIFHLYESAFAEIMEIKQGYLKLQESFMTHFRNIAVVTDEYYSNNIAVFAGNCIDNVKTRIEQNKRNNKLAWERLNQNLNIEKGPWSSGKVEYSYKRSSKLCVSYCPGLMRPVIKSNASIPLTTSLTPKHSIAINENGECGNSFEQEEIDKKVVDNKKYYECLYVKAKGCRKVMLYLDSDGFSVKFISNHENTHSSNQTKKDIFISKNDIYVLIKRKTFQLPNAMEIFTFTGKSLFLVFDLENKENTNKDNIDQILSQMVTVCQLTQRTIVIKDLNTLKDQIQLKLNMWKQAKCTNFEYLSSLNLFSGRSFNDVSQYPIFPWIIKDYSCNKLCFDNESIFRDLSKPIGVQNEENVKKLKIRYENQNENERCLFSSGPMPPASVSFYLKKMEPFNEMFIENTEIQSQSFTDIGEYFQQVVNEGKYFSELVPEFFFQPEFLTKEIHLPKWAKNNIDFIYLQRKALESNYVSAHLNEWIDLIFGSFQNSIDHLNVYDEKLYSNVWTKYQDPSMIDQIKSNLMLLGQLPTPIFTEKHPPRQVFNNNFVNSHINIENHNQEKNEKPNNENENICNQKNMKSNICSFSLTNDPQQQKQNHNILYSIFDGNYFYTLDSEAHISKYKVKFDTLQLFFKDSKPVTGLPDTVKTDFKMINKIFNTSNVINNIFNNYNFTFIYKLTKKNFVVYHRLTNSYYLIDVVTAIAKKIDTGLTKIKSIEISDQFSIFMTKNDMLCTIFEHGNKILTYKQYRSVPICCTVSSLFKTLVVGVEDGSFLIISLPSGQLTKIVEIDPNFIPLKVKITDGFGFIVIYGKMKHTKNNLNDGNQGNETHIFVYSINGLFVRKTKVEGEIIRMIKWKSNLGFDFMAFVIENKYEDLGSFNPNESKQKIALCEVYYLNIEILQSRFIERIVSFDYLVESDTLVIVQKDGNFTLIKYPIDDMHIE
ncbi:hypothetical protein TRFO_35805 [Tritrichomonas foetus]|uniref:BEACH domain-containing protein n=1 Tax=Tritrichomonas foetus TaxID=1144522 RepID=A0A1J4JFK5_9EUKA|nr:hypothetical protein TRFO_35805 [Tritrichomonas foetus]|eukprot:OHS97896.1 hypothetical protein TRFO_35805 [Tritrichomonas foetus]